MVVTPVEGFEAGVVSITGTVRLDGAPITPDKTVQVGGDAYCKAHGEIKSERWKVAENGGLAEVVIAVINAPGTPVRGEQPEITQMNCVYLPHVSGIGAGQTVKIRNDDETAHNVRIVFHQMGTLNKGRNLQNYSQHNQGTQHVERFVQPGVYRLECDIHRWMRSWIYVHSNNHVAVSGADGAFAVDFSLVDGAYEVSAWHPQFRNPLVQNVEVVNGKADIQFTFDAAQAMR